MCTSLVYQNKQNEFILARTMDFSLPLEGKPIFIPNDYAFYQNQPQKEFKNRFSFIGAGKLINEYIFADGVNSVGLSAASLYFSDDAVYEKKAPEEGKTIASHDMVAWLLGHCQTITDVKNKLPQLTLIEEESEVTGGVVPLHWLVADKSGASVVIESVATGLQIYDNPVGVMTNSPSFPWHLTNLNQYGNLSNTSSGKAEFKEFVAKGNGAGSGALGLPGDYTSISRFVRIAFMNQYAEKGENVLDSINIISRMLATVYIPKGVKIKTNGAIDYTQYMSFMDLSSSTYFINYYANNRFIEINLLEIEEKHQSPKIFELPTSMIIDKISN